MEYKIMIQEFSDKLESEVEKNRAYKEMFEKLDKNQSMFTSSSKKNDQMQ